MPVMPVANGMLPRPHGGRITGMFVLEDQLSIRKYIDVGRDILVCPWIPEKKELYPVGVVSRVTDLVPQTAADEFGNEIKVLVVVLEGREHARWFDLKTVGRYFAAGEIEPVNLRAMRKEYPAISGAGWVPMGGYTEFRSEQDIPVTIYGSDLEYGTEVSISANLGGLVTKEHAHTIEHSIIRAINDFGLCTPKTLMESMLAETKELKRSVESGIRLAAPEVLGLTTSGLCGNPMTNLARFYLAKEIADTVKMGESLNNAIYNARRSVMSRLTQDLGLSMQPGLRTLQGLKKGMNHDDTPLKLDTLKKVIKRFPFDPWG